MNKLIDKVEDKTDSDARTLYEALDGQRWLTDTKQSLAHPH
jgi:hypothetical protein